MGAMFVIKGSSPKKWGERGRRSRNDKAGDSGVGDALRPYLKKIVKKRTPHSKGLFDDSSSKHDIISIGLPGGNRELWLMEQDLGSVIFKGREDGIDFFMLEGFLHGLTRANRAKTLVGQYTNKVDYWKKRRINY